MSDSDFTIRGFAEPDRTAVLELWKACDLVRPWNDPDVDLDLFVETPSAEIFVGETAGKVIASIAVGHDGHRGWLYYLGVHPALRRKGYGFWLVRHSEAWLRERDVPKVQLLVRPDNLAVKSFYGRAGYCYNDCHIMERWLADRDAPQIEDRREDGRLEMLVTYLEMTAPLHLAQAPLPRGLKVALLRANPPSLSFYRYLYNTVGGPWLWFERRAMSDGDLQAIIEDEAIEIYVLYVNGTPAGYAELDRRQEDNIELAYFGLMPEFVGKGLGRYLLNWIIERAWSYEPKRLWVNTNPLDHRRALPLYQKCGFQPYKQEHKLVDDPRISGLVPQDKSSQ